MILYENERSLKSEYLYHQDDENLNFQKHAHYSFEFITVLEGELICEADDEKYQLKANQSLLILPGQIHSYQTDSYSKSYLCVFSNDLVSAFYGEIKGKKLSNPVLKLEDPNAIMETLKNADNNFYRISELYRLCAIAYSQSELLIVEQSNFALSSLIAFYVQNNYTKNISLKRLAAEQGYSYTYLSAFFNETFGQNFSSYVNSFRLQYAAHLLETTDYDITQIVSMSGFSTIRNFNIAFKAAYGLSPRDYRSSLH